MRSIKILPIVIGMSVVLSYSVSRKVPQEASIK